MRIGMILPNGRRVLTRVLLLTLATVVLGATECDPGMDAQIPLTRAERAAHLVSRTTFGMRAQDVDDVLAVGAEAWLERQLNPSEIEDQALQDYLETVDSENRRFMVVSRAPVVRVSSDSATNRSMQARAAAALAQSRILQFSRAQTIRSLASVKLRRAIETNRQLEEVMTDFWFNHFNVDYNKDQVRTAIDDYEKHAIRPHVFGRFEDLLIATAQHPAMLLYLDNAESTAPRADGGGLNENYARELLELHTLGVDGGYTQQDVIEVARAFTGWSVELPSATAAVIRSGVPSGGPLFDFRLDQHDQGEKLVLDHTLPAGRGIEDGLDVLRMLAAHPSTAEFIAFKLVQHFVADDPPPELVAEIATVFRETNGDLRAVTRALFTSERFYDRANFRAKTKRPFEYMASMLRATDATIDDDRALYTQLRNFGHLPYSEPAPTGYPTEASEWMSAGAVMDRINFAMSIAAGGVRGVSIDPLAVAGGPQGHAQAQAQAGVRGQGEGQEGAQSQGQAQAEELASALMDRMLRAVPADSLHAAVAEQLSRPDAPTLRVALSNAIGLILGSPEFQRY